jgi:hypothetical protein
MYQFVAEGCSEETARWIRSSSASLRIRGNIYQREVEPVFFRSDSLFSSNVVV